MARHNGSTARTSRRPQTSKTSRVAAQYLRALSEAQGASTAQGEPTYGAPLAGAQIGAQRLSQGAQR